MEEESNTFLPSSVIDMTFLFQKVDPLIFDPLPSRSSSIAENCLMVTLEEANILDNQLLLLVSTTLKRLLTIYRQFSQPLSIEYSKKIVDYVFRKWDSSVDVICYEAVDSFGLLLDIHTFNCQSCSTRITCEFVNELMKDLFTNPSTCRSYFKCFNLFSLAYPWLSLIDDQFVKKLYKNIESPSVVVVISDIICSNLSSPKSNRNLHLDCIECSLKSENKVLRSAVMDRLIPNLVKRGQADIVTQLLSMLHNTDFDNSVNQLEIILSLVSILIKTSGGKVWSDFMPREVLSKAVLHVNSQVRLNAWNLLCIHPRSSIPYTIEDLQLMKAYISTSLAEQAPAIRNKMLAAFKQAIIRIAETAQQILKKDGPKEIVEQYDEFLCEIVHQAFRSLNQNANFNRRVLSLSLIDYIYRQNYLQTNGKHAFWDSSKLKNLVNESYFEQLLICLDDPFQLCQIMSLNLLKSLEGFQFEGKSREEGFQAFLEKSKREMNSIRSSDSLTASYRFQFFIHYHPQKLQDILTEFMDDLEILLERAERNLVDITSNLLHPTLNVLVSLLPKSVECTFWKEFVHNRLIPLCYRIATLVTPVVHSMAPEGYVPEDELNTLTYGSSKDTSQLLLVCCWRAHKHVSEIFDWSIRTLYPQILASEDIHRIGEYFWLQLTECRHCGAFESAVEGFTFLCSFLWQTKNNALPHPIDWLKRILKALEGGEDLDNLCSTRRSAGVPHLVVAILSTEPMENGLEGLKLAVDSLLDLERRELKYRVHCLNVLKAIVHSSTMRERISFILEPACRLAVAGCSAQSWSERNSSAQLAAALRTHIFGVTKSSQRDLHVDPKNRQSAHEFFSRFPSLYSFLFHQLENVKDEFSAYPTLIFLIHLYATNTASKFQLGPFIPLCLKTLLWCKAEKLRRLSAVAAVAISQDDDVELILNWLRDSDLSNLKQNHVNSELLLLQAILITRPNLRETVARIAEKFGKDNCCDFNLNLLQELRNQLEFREDFSSFYFVAKVQEEILLSKSFEKIPSVDKFTRFEIYSWLDQAEKVEAPTEVLLTTALRDLEETKSEGERLLIKKVLDKYFNGSLDQEKLRKLLCNEIRDQGAPERSGSESHTSLWRALPENVAVSWSLLAKIGVYDLDSGLLEWARSTVDIEEDYPKAIAIELCTTRYLEAKKDDCLLILLDMLQDEDAEIREKTSSVVSCRILKKDFSLNPEICRLLLGKMLSFDERTTQEVLNKDERQNVLFDASEANIFSEKCLFFDPSVIENLLQ